MYGPQMYKNLEKLVNDMPGGKERIAMIRERMKGIRARMQKQQSA